MGRLAALLLLGFLAQSCVQSDNPSDLYPATEKEFSVLSITLPLLGTSDFGGQTLKHWLTQNPPDLCILQRIESKEALAKIATPAELKHYHQTWSTAASDGSLNLLLSKVAPREVIQHDQVEYTVKGNKYSLQNTPMEAYIPLADQSTLRCIIAPLLSKDFHPAGQSEMRRNEARLLGRLITQVPESLKHHHTLLLSSFLDHPQSDAMDKLTGAKDWNLVDAQPLDIARGAWTFYDSEKESGHRYDYLLSDPALAQRRVIGKCKIPTWLSPGKLESGHRPLYAVYHLKE